MPFLPYVALIPGREKVIRNSRWHQRPVAVLEWQELPSHLNKHCRTCFHPCSLLTSRHCFTCREPLQHAHQTHMPHPSDHLITQQPRFAISHSIKPWIIQSRQNWFLDSLIANQNQTSGPTVHSRGAIFDNQIFMEKWNVSRSFLLLAD